MRQQVKGVALAAVAALFLSAAVAQDAARTETALGLQTVFSQSFVGVSFKEIDIDLGAEYFTLVGTASDRTTLEIKSNTAAGIPLVTQDGKSLKVVQKNKKPKADGGICTVVLTLPQNYPPAEFELSLAGGRAVLDPFVAGTVEISVGTGSLSAQDIRAENEFELAVSGGTATLGTISTGDAEIAVGSGSLTAETVVADKQVRLAVNDGSLVVSRPETKLLAAAVKRGSLTVTAASADTVEVAADSGTAAVSLVRSFVRPSSLLVGSGSITLALPEESVFYSTASVGKGHFRSEFVSDTKGPELKVRVGKGTVAVVKAADTGTQ